MSKRPASRDVQIERTRDRVTHRTESSRQNEIQSALTAVQQSLQAENDRHAKQSTEIFTLLRQLLKDNYA